MLMLSVGSLRVDSMVDLKRLRDLSEACPHPLINPVEVPPVPSELQVCRACF